MGMFDEVLSNVGEPYKGGSKGFEYGTHTVRIGLVEAATRKLKSGVEANVIEVESYDPADEDKIGKSTLYFHTEGGAQMSVTKILGIMVHNVGEEKKDRVRELGKKYFGDITDLEKARDAAAKLMTEKFMGKGSEAGYEAYFFADPRGKYKTTNYGDLWHYPYEDPDADDRADKIADEVGGEKLEGDELKNATEAFDDL